MVFFDVLNNFLMWGLDVGYHPLGSASDCSCVIVNIIISIYFIQFLPASVAYNLIVIKGAICVVKQTHTIVTVVIHGIVLHGGGAAIGMKAPGVGGEVIIHNRHG